MLLFGVALFSRTGMPLSHSCVEHGDKEALGYWLQSRCMVLDLSPSMGSSAWQPYWEGEYCVVAWELMCFPANVHPKNNNFTSHEDHPWSRGGHGQKARPNTLLSCSFLCTPINTSPICIEVICIFGKIPQCWHKSTLYTPPHPFLPPPTAPPLSPNSFSPLLNLSLPEREKEQEREREGKRNEGRLGVKEVSLRGLHGL